MSQNIKAALANSPYVISHLLSNWQTWTNYSQRDCPSNLYFQHVGHFLPFLSFCQFFKGLQHSTNARFDTRALCEIWYKFRWGLRTPVSSQKDGTCFGLFCVLGFTVFCVLKDLVSLLKPVSRLATAVAVSHFKWRPNLAKPAKTQRGKGDKACRTQLLTPGQIVYNIHVIIYNFWAVETPVPASLFYSIPSSCYNLPLPVDEPFFMFTQPNTFLFLVHFFC